MTLEEIKALYEERKNNNMERYRYVVCRINISNNMKTPIWLCKTMDDAIRAAEDEYLLHGIEAIFVDLERITV